MSRRGIQVCGAVLCPRNSGYAALLRSTKCWINLNRHRTYRKRTTMNGMESDEHELLVCNWSRWHLSRDGMADISDHTSMHTCNMRCSIRHRDEAVPNLDVDDGSNCYSSVCMLLRYPDVLYRI